MPTGKFVLKTAASGGVRYNLYATNGQVIATGDTFADLPACQNEIEAVRAAAAIAPTEDQTRTPCPPLGLPKFEIYRDRAGEFRFRLRGQTGKILLVGEGYKAKASCQKGVLSVRKNAPISYVELDLT